MDYIADGAYEDNNIDHILERLDDVGNEVTQINVLAWTEQQNNLQSKSSTNVIIAEDTL